MEKSVSSTLRKDIEASMYKDPNRPVSERVDDLLARMTLDEKLAQIGSVLIYDLLDEGGFSQEKACRLDQGIGQVTRPGTYTLLPPRQRAELTNTIQDYLVNNTRLGIPAIFHDECCSGYAALGATRFPQMIGLASTFRPELAEAMSDEIRKQMRSTGSHQGLGPVLDVFRDPRWGRVEETFGEDPNLVARFGAAYIRGLQGETLKDGVMATAKHFLAHSASDGGLNCTPVHMGPREVREVFLLPFEAAVHEARTASIMHSYSELDGRVVAADETILGGLLREELGFEGLLVSDYLAIEMLHNFHFIAEDLSQAAVMALRAGIELELPETLCYGKPLLEALQRGDVAEAHIDAAVRRVLAAKFALGLFEQPFAATEEVEAVYQDPHPKALAREIAGQSLVLLKNEGGLLPLPSNPGRLAVIGPNAADGRNHLSDYSHASMIAVLLDGNPALQPLLESTGSKAEFDRSIEQIPTVLDAARARVSPETEVIYAKGCENAGSDRSGFEAAVEAARQADTILLVLGDHSGLTPPCTTGEFCDRAGLGLPGVQLELAQAVVAAAQGKPVVVVLINGRPLEITWLSENVPAILEAWLPGEQAAPAVAGALFGDINPGGKLPVTIARSAGQLPVFYNHKPSGGKSHPRGEYTDLTVRPLYNFGHGLSYTCFEYANLEISSDLGASSTIKISCEVRNTGTRSGDEVVQLYLQDEYASVPRPVKELKGFLRVRLAPQQAAHVTFTITPAHLAYYDTAMKLTVEPGKIRVMVGSGSTDIRLEGAFSVLDQIAVQRRSSQIIGTAKYLD